MASLADDASEVEDSQSKDEESSEDSSEDSSENSSEDISEDSSHSEQVRESILSAGVACKLRHDGANDCRVQLPENLKRDIPTRGLA